MVLTIDTVSAARWHELEARAKDLCQLDTDIKWSLADLALEAQSAFPDDWTALFDGRISSIQTLRNRMLVATRFKPLQRIYDVPFWCYQEVYAKSDRIVATLLSEQEQTPHRNRDAFRARIRQLLGKPAQMEPHYSTARLSSLADVLGQWGITEDDALSVTFKDKKVIIEIVPETSGD